MGLLDFLSPVASVAGGLIGGGERSSANQQQMELIRQSINDLQAIGIPPIEAQQLALEQYRSAGQLSPELEEAFQQQSSGLNDISTDPRLKEAQLNALTELQGIGASGGMRLSDQAAAQQAMGNIQAQERGSREAIEQSLREKGRFGGGDELAMKLANQQNSATNANQVGLGLAAQAQQNALNALMQGGKLGGEMQSQEFNQQAKIKEAQDAINRFNAQNSQEVAMRNAAAKNYAQQQNLTNMQNIMNANTGLSNDQQQFNKGLLQSNYNNQLSKANSMANARSGQANQIGNYGNQQAQMWTGIGNTVGQGIGAFAMDANKQGGTNATNKQSALFAKSGDLRGAPPESGGWQVPMIRPVVDEEEKKNV